jgi:RNA methyltransferase, TrmH family
MMPVIESSSNPRIQRIIKLLKARKQNQFVVEGKKLVQEALEAGIHFEEIFLTPAMWSSQQHWIEQLPVSPSAIYQIPPNLLKMISDVETPQGMVGVAQKPKPPATPLQITTVALLLVSIRDPGNFGAILRTAEAFGCEWVGHSSDSADPFQPKVVRSSMGSLFRIPIVEIEDFNTFLKEQIKRKISTYALETRNGRSLSSWKPAFPFILCIGSESQGLPRDLPVIEKISIPMKGRVESLNAGVAAAVCIYHAVSAFHRYSEEK